MIQFGDKLDSNKILALLSLSLPYYLKSWQDISETTGLFGTTDPQSFNMKKVGSSSPVIEYVLRPHLQVLCILSAFLYKKDYAESELPLSRKEIIDRVERGLNWVTATHLTGDTDVESFLERKRWGENWRSGMWASLAALCTHLARPYLSSALIDKVNTVLAFEADRFIGVLPPSGCEVDTKLEENAQDAMVLSWACTSLPDHPNVPLWEQALCQFAINIATCVHDKADHSDYFGQSVARWVSTQTLFPDMTAENHGFFHPQIL